MKARIWKKEDADAVVLGVEDNQCMATWEKNIQSRDDYVKNVCERSIGNLTAPLVGPFVTPPRFRVETFAYDPRMT